MYLELKPVYYRDYTSKQQLINDFNAGRHFILHTINGDQAFINREQLLEYASHATLVVKYGKCKKTIVLQPQQWNNLNN